MHPFQTTSPLQTPQPAISPSSFHFLSLLGEGGFCKVWKARHKQSRKTFAIKETSKLTITDDMIYESIITEKDILSELHHNFITNMYCSFQDKEKLYIVLDYINGGDLRELEMHHRKITEPQLSKLIHLYIIHI
jgi:serine/threonine protein kinase